MSLSRRLSQVIEIIEDDAKSQVFAAACTSAADPRRLAALLGVGMHPALHAHDRLLTTEQIKQRHARVMYMIDLDSMFFPMA